MSLQLTSSAFAHGQPIPKRYSAEDADVSPPLAWSDPPTGTQSLTLICDDPDAPRKTPWVHWVLFNLPSNLRMLDEDQAKTGKLANGATQGKNDSDGIGYSGPYPPSPSLHRYFFKLYALDTSLSLSAGATKDEVLAACQGHILDQGELMGTYRR